MHPFSESIRGGIPPKQESNPRKRKMWVAEDKSINTGEKWRASLKDASKERYQDDSVHQMWLKTNVLKAIIPPR